MHNEIVKNEENVQTLEQWETPVAVVVPCDLVTMNGGSSHFDGGIQCS